MRKYDVCIIGGGPSGYAAAMRAIDFDKRVILIERDEIGGAGITNGALSSKTWWEISRQFSVLRQRSETLHMDMPEISFRDVKEDVDHAVQERKDLLMDHLEKVGDDEQMVFCQGDAKLTSANQVEVTRNGQTEVIEADYLVLATGSRPRILPHIPVDEEVILTSDGISNLKDFPESMVILGAGVIGCEFATIFSGFGKTKVNLIDKGERILPFEDEDVVKVIEETMEQRGVNIHRNSRLIRMEVVEGRVEYELQFDDGSTKIFNVEKALISVGRVPNYESLGLEDVGVELDARGVVDKETQTSVSNIYAVGDITADIALVNVGELEGRYAVERMFSTPARPLVYENISTIMFLDPEVAGVGLNEIQAQEKGINYRVACVGYSFIARATANRDTRGFIKLLVTNDESNRLLGMRVIGQGASAAIQAVALLISMDKGIEELAECVHPHPSITEGIQECVRLLLGKSLFKPHIYSPELRCITCVDGDYLED